MPNTCIEALLGFALLTPAYGTMNLTKAEIQREVESRAGHRCEYCRRHQALQGASFPVEHIVPIALGGTDDLDNLAWACPGCNLKKSNRVTAVDPATGADVRLLHPRRNRKRSLP
ncbi:MAG TPA: HNH endonuclease signature motif containing protein [Candidatus Binatia bacterium]|nr:HNH endonuclease signature motif containing protein [Candidatus Binatia bacterium]